MGVIAGQERGRGTHAGAGGTADAASRRPPAAARTNPVWESLAFGARTLTVSEPGDASEVEADRIADRVMSGSAPPVMESPPARVQRSAAAGAAAPAAHTPDVATALGSGAPIDAPTRRWFETRMGADLRGVRVHTDAAAGGAARDLHANAFAVGSHVAFADGRYSPQTASGRRLLAHELAHVLQGGHAIRRSAVPGNVTPGGGEGDRSLRGIYMPARSGGAAAIPSPESCPPPKGMACTPASSPVGAVAHTFLFAQDSASLSTLQRTEIDAAAGAWHTAGGATMLRVDGFASAEGPCEYNWNLSCRRAQAVQSELNTPRDGSAGVPAGSIELFAHGESDEAGPALAPNRKATISLPTPPPPPPPTSTPPTCTFPVLIGTGRTGCGSGPDFGHFDYPPNTLSTASAAKLAGWAAARPLSRGPFRSLVTDTECELEMDGVLVALAGGDGHAAFTQFVSGAGGTVTHGNSSSLGALALVSGSFLATVATVKADIETQLAAQAASGALDPCALAVTPPATAFGFPDGAPLKAVIGGTHGETLWANGFTGSVAMRTYSIDLNFVICDNFGVDESDLYAHGLYGFWVLQHERSATAYAPFINELNLTVTVTGTF